MAFVGRSRARVYLKVQVGEHVGLSSPESGGHPGEASLQHTEGLTTTSRAVSRVGCRKIDFTTASTAGACSLGTALPG
jgi:hypothetical protein